MDIVDKKTRSRMMAGIRSRDTKPEVLVRKLLHRIGFRYRLGTKIGKIRPDVVLRTHRVAVFVHGCFWHQHENCKLAYQPKTNKRFWKEKLSRNIERDKTVESRLKDEGWEILIIWECEVRSEAYIHRICSLRKTENFSMGL